MHSLCVRGGLLHHILLGSAMRLEIAVHANVPTTEMLLLIGHDDLLLGKGRLESDAANVARGARARKTAEANRSSLR